MTIWNNGREVYRSDAASWWAPDAISFETVSDAGENRFLVCVDQGRKCYGDYGSWFSISDTGDLEFTRP